MKNHVNIVVAIVFLIFYSCNLDKKNEKVPIYISTDEAYLQQGAELLAIDSFMAKISYNEIEYWHKLDSVKKHNPRTWFSITDIKNISKLNCRIYYCKDNSLSHGYLRFIILKDLKKNKFYYMHDYAGAEFIYVLNLYNKEQNNTDFFDSHTKFDYLIGLNDFINDHPQLSMKNHTFIKTGKHTKYGIDQYKLDKDSKLLDSLLTYTILYSYNEPAGNIRIDNEHEIDSLIHLYEVKYNTQANKIIDKQIILKNFKRSDAILYKGRENQIILVLLTGSRVLYKNGIELEFLPFYGSFNLSAFSFLNL